MRKKKSKLRALRDNEMADTRIITCKRCKQDKTAILVGRWGRYGKEKKWVDSNGKTFNGKVCPMCHVQEVTEIKELKKQMVEVKDGQ